MRLSNILIAVSDLDLGWIPKSWTGIIAIGAVLGFVLAWFSTREARKRTAMANQETVNAYKETVSAVERQTLAVTAERDDYREKLHTEKNEHNAAALRIKELEMRPDVTTLFQSSEIFYREQAKVSTEQVRAVTELANAFRDHDKGVGERMAPVYDSLRTMGEGIKELLKRSDKKAMTPQNEQR